jgi:uncharacterized membrane protein YdjX (TVP38/TMEM64 family)
MRHRNRVPIEKLSRGFIRLISGFMIALGIYYASITYASVDCHSLQMTNQSGGITSAIKITLLLALISVFGAPSTITGIIAGLLLGPAIGAPLASLAIVLASMVFWGIGCLFRDKFEVKNGIESRLLKQRWFNSIMMKKSNSSFHWTLSSSMIVPISYPVFALICGMLVPHLTFISTITGIFAASVFHVAGYALAGGSIGCAVMNHALGLSFENYKIMMFISCFILLLLSRLQSHFEKAGDV